MKLANLIQWIAVTAVWVVMMLLLVIFALLSMTLSVWTMPMWWILVLFAIGVAASAFIITTDRFEELNEKITHELSGLDDEEMLEIMQGLDKLRDNMGISVELPIQSKKNKRQAVDTAIRNLSDTELLHLKDQLRAGDIDESRLLAWLDEQRNQGDVAS